jgi:hypothetical protein
MYLLSRMGEEGLFVVQGRLFWPRMQKRLRYECNMFWAWSLSGHGSLRLLSTLGWQVMFFVR